MTKSTATVTIEEFLKNFEAKRIKEGAIFKLNQGGRIREDRDRGTPSLSYCPIEFVAGTPLAFLRAGDLAGLSDLDRTRIITAADDVNGIYLSEFKKVPFEPLLRNQLLKAAGLMVWDPS